jgi:hypothetical protein
MGELAETERISKRILLLRGHRVMLDADLARLYGVTTKRFNEAFKRNRHRFPDDFAFQLTVAEFANLRSQFVTSKLQPLDSHEDDLNWSQFATSSSRHRGSVYRPWAFTEHGALMAANILRSERAVQMSVLVIRAFVRLREMIASHKDLAKRLDELEKKYDMQFKSVFDAIRQLMAPIEPPRRRIGFRRDEPL